ncbi:MAG: hypothetical protein IKZ39_08110, partial [Lachnospiraceae bacterium]|nr:hypothetical protein [Lachnospiraceae bacterium]
MRTSRSFAEKKYIVFFSLLGAVFFFALIYFTAGIWFENNDDVFISEMLSGKITGEAEYHSSFIGILVTWPVAMLYRAFHAVPWWGIVIFSMLFVAVWINLHYCMKSANDWIELSIYTVVEVALLVAGIHCFGQAQFSSAAM